MSAQFIDKAGRVVKAGDIIVYGHALGRCAALQYGKALKVKTLTKSEYNWQTRESKEVGYAHLTVQGVEISNWNGEITLLRKGTLQFGDRTLIVTRDQVPKAVLELLDSVKIEGSCDDCGKVGDDVKETVCPYQADVNDKVVAATLCGVCEHERAMDI